MIYYLTAHFVFTSSNTHMLCVYISLQLSTYCLHVRCSGAICKLQLQKTTLLTRSLNVTRTSNQKCTIIH